MKIQMKILNKDFYKDEALLPKYQTSGSAAMDLCITEDVTLAPGKMCKVGTGLAIWIGSATVASLILPRSSLGIKGVVLGNTAGLIDADYQGELQLPLWNRHHPNEAAIIHLKAGERVAQLMFIPVLQAQWSFVEEFSCTTERGEGGFGSSGK